MFLTGQITFERAGLVTDAVDIAPGDVVVGQLHYIIQVITGSADMQDIDESIMGARDRLQCRHPREFAFERSFAFKRDAVNHLYRPPSTGWASRQPDLAISAASDHAKNFVIRNRWDLG